VLLWPQCVGSELNFKKNMKDKPEEIKGLEVGKEIDLMGKRVKVIESEDAWMMCFSSDTGGYIPPSFGGKMVKLGWWHEGNFKTTTLRKKEVDILL